MHQLLLTSSRDNSVIGRSVRDLSYAFVEIDVFAVDIRKPMLLGSAVHDLFDDLFLGVMCEQRCLRP